MGRPRKKKAIDDPIEEDFLSEEISPSEELFSEFIAGLGEYDKVQIYRRPLRTVSNPNPLASRKLQWLCDISPDELFEIHDIIQKEWGAGSYCIKFILNSKYVASRNIEIGEARGSAAAKSQDGKSNGSVDMVQFMQQQMLQQQQLLMGMIASMKGPDLGTLLSGIAAIGRPPDSAAMLTAVATVFGQLRSAGGDSDWLEKAKNIVSLAKDLSPDGGGDSWLGVMRDVGIKVIENLKIPAIAGMPVAAPPPATDAPMLTTTTSATVDAQPVKHERTQEEIMGDWIRLQLNALKKKALNGADTRYWAEYIADNTDEPGCAAVLQAIHRGATLDHLLQFDAEIATNPTLLYWFSKLYEDIHAVLREDMDSPGSPGNVPDSGNHAGGSDPGQPDSGSKKSRKSTPRPPNG